MSESSELIKQVQKGDRDSFRKIYQEYKQKVFSLCYSVLRDSHLAEEALQDTFVKVHNKIKSFNFSYSFGAWISRIAINSALDILRRIKREKGVSIEENNIDVPIYISEAPDETIQNVWKVIDRLPEDLRIALILRDIQGLSGEEASESLGIKHETLRWRLHRARLMFKELWQQTQQGNKS